MGGFCAFVAALHPTDPLSCQSLGFFVQARCSTGTYVKEKGLITSVKSSTLVSVITFNTLQDIFTCDSFL